MDGCGYRYVYTNCPLNESILLLSHPFFSLSLFLSLHLYYSSSRYSLSVSLSFSVSLALALSFSLPLSLSHSLSLCLSLSLPVSLSLSLSLSFLFISSLFHSLTLSVIIGQNNQSGKSILKTDYSEENGVQKNLKLAVKILLKVRPTSLC